MSGRERTCAVCGRPDGVVHVADGPGYRLVCLACLAAEEAPVSPSVNEEDAPCS